MAATKGLLMDYQTNFHKSKGGNAIRSGDTLVVSIDDAHVSGGVYVDDLPIQAGFGFRDVDTGNRAEMKFKLAKRAIVDGEWRTVGLKLGTYVLKVRGANGQGIDDEFLIL